MLKTVLFAGAALLALAAAPAWAQGPVSGQVMASPSSERPAVPVVGATVLLDGVAVTTTDATGLYQLPTLAAGPHRLQFRVLGLAPAEVPVTGSGQAQALPPVVLQGLLTPEVTVSATRATDKTGTAYQNVSGPELQARNFGQDIPYLLDQTPSVVTTSDAGTGIGYTGLRIRGTDGTRINVTLNGVPVNEAESHGVFFVDLPDLASSVQSIQVQRGAGPSTNGAGAFGASLNVETLGVRPTAYAEINNSAGSFGTWKSTVMAGSGLLNGHFTVDARASRIQSEGYIDRARARLKSLYLSGTYSDDKNLLRALVLTGYQTTYQSWFGLAQDSLRGGNRRANQAGTDYGQHQPAYANQTDNYQQDYYQFLLSRQLTPAWNLSVTPFWTRGGGYYEEYKANQAFAAYNIGGPVYQPRPTGGFDTLTTTDLIRRRWLKTDLYGATYALQWRPASSRLTEATLGGAVVGYRGQHFDELTWAERGLRIPETGHRYYNEPTARKTDVNIYARANIDFTERLSAFGDVQYRYVDYSFFGPAAGGGKSQQTVQYHFLNPKAGLTYRVNDQDLTAYASYALAQREPTRTDFTDTPAQRRPAAEKLHNLEVGLRQTSGRVQWSANYYLMRYRDQLVLSGQLDDVGNAIHTNVPDSYRTGLELQAAAQVARGLTFSPTATVSRNKITNYTAYLTDYDQGGERATTYQETDISFSPSLTFAYTLEYELLPGLRLATLARYAGHQYLDNTSTTTRRLDPYYVQDVRLRHRWQPGRLGLREVELAVLVNNLFGAEYANNGYTYGYVSDGQAQYFNFFYPQATTNFLASLNLRF